MGRLFVKGGTEEMLKVINFRHGHPVREFKMVPNCVSPRLF
jgi:hypothetical protein